MLVIVLLHLPSTLRTSWKERKDFLCVTTHGAYQSVLMVYAALDKADLGRGLPASSAWAYQLPLS